MTAACALSAGALRAGDWQLTSLGEPPAQDTTPDSLALSSAAFAALMDDLYAPHADWAAWFSIDAASDTVSWPRAAKDPSTQVTLPLRAEAQSAGEARWYVWEARRAQRGLEQPLAGLRIVLDPGHLGGVWAEMEHRAWSVEAGVVVKEGDLVLQLAQMLEAELTALGATVTLTRRDATPATALRPADLIPQAEAWQARLDAASGHADDAQPQDQAAIQRRAELLFYRTAEIRARVPLVAEAKPDLVLCLHLNGTGWPDPENPSLVEDNHLHVLVNGAYMAGELAYDDTRAEMLTRLAAGHHAIEAPVALALAAGLAERTGLPPFTYRGSNAAPLPAWLIAEQAEALQAFRPYVWARNLLANRLFPAPVVFLEPYVLNSEGAYRHLMMGDYEGWRDVEGVPRRNLLRTYADGVILGLLQAAAPAAAVEHWRDAHRPPARSDP